jgi:hypothetical protein
MSVQFHHRESTLVALAVGGLVAFSKDLWAGVIYLYKFALTPQGNAALTVGTFLILLAILTVSLVRR